MGEDLNYILAAKIGHVGMLKAIFGSSDDDSAQPQSGSQAGRQAPGETPPPLTTEAFDILFQGNAKRRTG